MYSLLTRTPPPAMPSSSSSSILDCLSSDTIQEELVTLGLIGHNMEIGVLSSYLELMAVGS